VQILISEMVPAKTGWIKHNAEVKAAGAAAR
jgi:hypothetical protein